MSGPTPSLGLRIDLPRGRIGPGKIDLLEAIAREGSISGAARAMGMSYRRAWELVDSLNVIAGQPVVAAQPGGRRGGGAALTALGVLLVAEFRAIEREAQAATAARLAALLRRTQG